MAGCKGKGSKSNKGKMSKEDKMAINEMNMGFGKPTKKVVVVKKKK